jgi:phytoene synthase
MVEEATLTQGSNALSYCADQVRRYDPDRFLTALYAPADRRDALMTLYAFNLEIAKVRETVSEPMLGEIRLQWWREAIEEAYGDGPVRRHAVVEPLAATIRLRGIARTHFERIIDARAFDLDDDPPETVAALCVYAENTSSALLHAALDILGAAENPDAVKAARHLGVAWAIVGLIRAMPHHLRQRRLYLPRDIEIEAGVDRRSMLELQNSPALEAAIAILADIAHAELAAARAVRDTVPRTAIPALLPAVLADGHLKRLERARYNVFDPRLAQRPGLLSARLSIAAMRRRY